MKSPLWTTEIIGSWGAPRKIRVVTDLRALFYIDSWGVALLKSQLRKFDLQTGCQTDSFVARSPVYGLDVDNSDNFKIAINTSKKVFVLSPGLEELERFESRVPSDMSHVLKLARVLVMRSNLSDTVHLFDLDSAKVRRRKVGSGGPLFRDIFSETALICSGKEGIVWRMNVRSGDAEILIDNLQFDYADIDYDKNLLWLSEGEPYVLEHRENKKTIRPGAPTNILRSVSLSDRGPSERIEMGFEFKMFSVSRQSQFVWIGRNEGQRAGTPPKSIHIFETSAPSKEVARFTLPDSESFINHIDAKAGLVFSESEGKRGNDSSFKLHCWNVTL